jgi:predicted nucleic-acid-binding protein
VGRGAASDPTKAERGAGVTAFVDTNILVRHLTGDPPDLAARATRFLQEADELLLPDLILAEVVYVLESFYEVPRERVAEIGRTILAFDAITVIDRDLLLRAIELYEVDRLDFADAYLVASAEVTGVGVVASFDQAIGRVATVQRLEPPLV